VYYLIDGYNFLFSFVDSKQSLLSQRKIIISFIKEKFSICQLEGTLVFDGARKHDEESGISYAPPLEIVYTPKGQTADEYIVEKVSRENKEKQFTVVTNDRGLKSHCSAVGTKVLLNLDFLKWLQKKTEKNSKKPFPKESQANLDRLLKIFEERVKETKDWD